MNKLIIILALTFVFSGCNCDCRVYKNQIDIQDSIKKSNDINMGATRDSIKSKSFDI